MISGIKVTGYHQSSGLFYVIIQCLSQHFFSKNSCRNRTTALHLRPVCVCCDLLGRWFALLFSVENRGKYKHFCFKLNQKWFRKYQILFNI